MQPEFNTLLPWHERQWRMLSHAIQQDQIPQALLLHGPGGVGKSQFMRQYAQSLLCMQPRSDEGIVRACGRCKSCQQYSEAGEHADLLHIGIVEGDREIKIDAVRRAAQFTSLGAHYGGRKLLLINPADAINRNAANALLKTLEEPSKNVVILLCSTRPAAIMATIRSRCMHLRFDKPNTDIALGWLRAQNISDSEQALAEAAGLPLKACEMAQQGDLQWRAERDRELLAYLKDARSASGLAGLWAQEDINSLHAWLYDRIRRSLWLNSNFSVLDDTQASLLEFLSKALRPGSHARVKDLLNELIVSELTNINRQLCLESLLITLAKRDDQTPQLV